MHYNTRGNQTSSLVEARLIPVQMIMYVNKKKMLYNVEYFPIPSTASSLLPFAYVTRLGLRIFRIKFMSLNGKIQEIYNSIFFLTENTPVIYIS